MKRARRIVLALVIGLGLVCAAVPESVQKAAYSQSETDQDLSTYFDWRDRGALTPVRSQGECAAGWAFTATAMLESAVLRDTGRRVDLSEQYLLSCGGPDFSCTQGGWAALDLFQSAYLPPQTDAGAVLESALPYRAKPAACARAYPHPYRIDRWGYVNPDGASEEQIKQALLEYGPLGTALCAGPEFQHYRAGVYRADESAACVQYGVRTNHALLITGWDDLRGCWLVKNSWGPGWGQGGYGCLRYGLPGIAENAVYLIYRSEPGLTLLASPSSGVVVKSSRPQLAWRAASGQADGYQLQIARDPAFTAVVLDARVTGLTYLPDADLPADALLYWRVRAWRGPDAEILYGKWSAARTLKTLPVSPVPLSPVNETAAGPRPTFAWDGPTGTRYDLQISWLAGCERALRSAQVAVPGVSATSSRLPAPSYTPSSDLPLASALYWRVRARGRYGPGPWSACVPFRTP